MPRPGIFLCCAILLTAWAGSVRADGVVRDSIGGTAGGRGGTNIAHSDNGTVLLSNPAGIVNAPGRGLFEIGVDGLATDLDYSDPQNNAADFMPFALPQISYIRKSADERWAAGIGVFVPAGFGAEWEMNAPFPINGRREYESLGTLVKVLPSLAWRVNDRLSVGATVGLAYSYAELDAPFFVQSGLLRGTPTLLHLEADGTSPTWSLGAQYQVSDRTTVGIAYTSETRFRLDGDADVTVFGLLPDPTIGIPSEFDLDADLVWPRSLGIGITHWLDCECRRRLSLDVLWFDWSHAFDRIDLKLSDPSNLAFAALAPIRDNLPLEWRDSISVRLGHEYWLTPCDVFRLGYVYNSKMIPDSTLTPHIPATLEHAFTVGYGRQRGQWHINAAYEFSFAPNRHVADSKIVGGDFDASVSTARAHWLFFSIMREF